MKAAKNLGGIVYVIIWAALILSYWMGLFSPGDEMLFSVVSIYIILPIAAFVVSVIYGKQEGNAKWFFVVFACMAPVLCQSLTFDLENTLAFGNINPPKLQLAVFTLIPALLGIGIGCFVRGKKNSS